MTVIVHYLIYVEQVGLLSYSARKVMKTFIILTVVQLDFFQCLWEDKHTALNVNCFCDRMKLLV